jgi:hypothetical protein
MYRRFLHMPKTSPSGWLTFFNGVVRPRLEIMVTIILDSGAIVVALLCRGLTLRAYHYGVDGFDAPRHIRALEWVLDYGIVAMAAAMLVFDLGKRIKTGWQSLFQDDQRK